SCVDRATAGITRIGKGTKIDNIVQIGHNVVVGEHTVIAGQAGIAGSAEVGSRVVMGGRVAVRDHTTVADDIVLGGGTGVTHSLLTPGEYLGTPPLPLTQAIRSMSLFNRLPELFRRLRALESKVSSDQGK
ncbi:MAG: UDP-3-O-(3-hydroxymyristoyl)glucosamine N-acyltransferase, partial [Armatimonadota bacterium]